MSEIFKKFQIGDRVKIIKSVYKNPLFKIGCVGKIDKFFSGAIYINGYIFYESELELYKSIIKPVYLDE